LIQPIDFTGLGEGAPDWWPDRGKTETNGNKNGPGWRMIRKSGHRFSEKIMRKRKGYSAGALVDLARI
jgi:hypothetical protein